MAAVRALCAGRGCGAAGGTTDERRGVCGRVAAVLLLRRVRRVLVLEVLERVWRLAVHGAGGRDGEDGGGRVEWSGAEDRVALDDGARAGWVRRRRVQALQESVERVLRRGGARAGFRAALAVVGEMRSQCAGHFPRPLGRLHLGKESALTAMRMQPEPWRLRASSASSPFQSPLSSRTRLLEHTPPRGSAPACSRPSSLRHSDDSLAAICSFFLRDRARERDLVSSARDTPICPKRRARIAVRLARSGA